MIAKPLQIFYAGTHTAVSGHTATFTLDDVKATAAAYDPSLLEAPLVVGHPVLDDPAYGWVQSLHLSGTVLEATPRAVDLDFAQMVNDERFNRISASFFRKDAPSNPVPGTYYLKHVGFLGAAPPAVRGLRKPSFALAAEADTITLEFALSPSEMMTVTEPVSVPQTPPPAPPTASPSVDFAAREAAIASREAAIASREATLKAEEQRQRRAADLAFADQLIEQGRLLPRDQQPVVALLAQIPAVQPMEFADPEAEGQTVKTFARAWLMEFLKRLPPQIDYAERTAATDENKPPAGALSRKAFERIDPQQRKAHLARGGKIVD